VGLFGLGDFSHSLLILAATQLLSPRLGVVRAAQLAGLLYVGRNLVQVLCSYPIGAAADRRGALRVLGFGYVLGTATALCTALLFWHGAASLPALGGLFLLAGLYVAVQEALESTVTAELVAGETMASSLGALSAVNGVAKLLSSTGVGVLWSAVSPVVAFGAAALLMAGGTLALSRLRQEDRVR
jgi:MFS family permease